MRKFLKATIIASVTGIALLTSSVSADIREVARDLVESKSDAVVTIEVVQSVKSSYMGNMNEEETKAEAIAVIIDDSGMAVTSLSSVDQSALFRRIMGEDAEYDVDAQVKSVKYILANNEEVAATVVLRDPDLDIAILRPLEEPEDGWTSISMESSARAELLDEVFSIGRMGKIARRQPAASIGSVYSMVKRPRQFYVLDTNTQLMSIGMPIFNAEGSALGMLLYYSIPGAGQSNSDEPPVLPVLVPAADIMEVASQAPEAAPADEAAAEAGEVEEEEMATSDAEAAAE